MKSLAWILLCCSGGLLAQQPATSNPQPPAGRITGSVICGDTGQPARFAGVQLIAEKTSQKPLFDASTLGKNPNFERLLASAMTAMMKGSNLSTLTGLDGSFSLDKIPAGTYYVVVQLPGYVSPLSQVSQKERLKASAETMNAVESSAEKVVLQPGEIANVTVRLERGATLSGTVRYDDGSPAPSVTPMLLEQQTDGSWKELQTFMLPATSDDRGHFRFYGLAAGKYAVEAALPTTQAMTGLGMGAVSLHIGAGDALVVYSSGALRQKDIKPVELPAGEDLDGVDVVFPLSGLRSLSGSVVAKADNHPLNSGTLALVDPESQATLRTAMIEQDGSFHLNYVPDGQYILRLTSAFDLDTSGTGAGESDLARMLHSKPLKSYGDTEMPLLVKSDLSGLTLQAPDAPAKAAK